LCDSTLSCIHLERPFSFRSGPPDCRKKVMICQRSGSGKWAKDGMPV
jgi:hypothetical protein